MNLANEVSDSTSEIVSPATDRSPLIVIVSNRGPLSFSARKDGSFAVKRGVGGLVTALGALAERYEVLWVAAAQSQGDHRWAKEHEEQVQNVDGIRLRLIRINRKRYQQYYNEIANPLLWFIQHRLWDYPRKPVIDETTWNAWWNGYVAVNKQFAEAVAASVKDIDRPVVVLPQDYHLYLVPGFLREMLGDRVQIQPFVHIPWPGSDAWQVLPETMRTMILSSMLASDRIGFQTAMDSFNFVQNCRLYLGDAHSRGTRDTVHYLGRAVKAVTYPISVDVAKVLALTEDPQTRLHKSQLINLIGDRRLILRVDRVEPSKNILRGLLAFRALLEKHPEHRGKLQMLALLVPSRMEVDEYKTYLGEIMAEAGLINAQFSDEFWEPVRIIVGDNYSRAIAAMQLYDVLLVNPVTDGMNLVAKEGVLVNERNGVLVLSELAGAYYELGDKALAVSPFDVYGTAEAMHMALVMDIEERKMRAEVLRGRVKKAGVRRWFLDQLADAARASSSQVKKSSTPSTPATSMSEESYTSSGVPVEITPSPTQ